MASSVVVDRYTVSHFSNQSLLADLKARVANERGATAIVLSRLVEVEDRRLFLEEGYSCMKDFCVRELHYSEGAAYKRINAARAARDFPQILDMLAAGRLHLSGVVMLSKYLRSGNADELLSAATHQSSAQIELLIANRFGRPDWPDRLQVSAPAPASAQAVPTWLAPLSSGKVNAATDHVSTDQTAPPELLSSGIVEAPAPYGRVKPLSPGRHGFQGTWDQEGYELYNEVRALVSHQVPSGELSLVLVAAMRIAKAQLEKRKYGATNNPRPARPTRSKDHIPATVRRAVRQRDGNRCSFVSDSGRRCEETRFLQFDHEVPRARGGRATVGNTRLYCRAHNLHAAEREFGVDFMSNKRGEARERARRSP